MNKCKYFMLMLTLMITLCSCGGLGKNTDKYSKIYEKYKNIRNFQSEIMMEVTSNKTTKHYRLKQYYQAPDQYKVEVIEPDDIKGLVTTYKEGNVTTVLPDIQGKFTLLNFSPVREDYIFLPDFFEAYYKSEQAFSANMTNKEGQYTVFRANLPGGNIYRFSQAVWFDNTSLLPAKIEICDIKNEAVIVVKFIDFNMNTEINDQMIN